MYLLVNQVAFMPVLLVSGSSGVVCLGGFLCSVATGGLVEEEGGGGAKVERVGLTARQFRRREALRSRSTGLVSLCPAIFSTRTDSTQFLVES